MLPSASCTMHEARTIALPIVCWVWPMHQTIVLGRFSAIISATLKHRRLVDAAGLLDLVGRPLGHHVFA